MPFRLAGRASGCSRVGSQGSRSHVMSLEKVGAVRIVRCGGVAGRFFNLGYLVLALMWCCLANLPCMRFWDLLKADSAATGSEAVGIPLPPFPIGLHF